MENSLPMIHFASDSIEAKIDYVSELYQILTTAYPCRPLAFKLPLLLLLEPLPEIRLMT